MGRNVKFFGHILVFLVLMMSMSLCMLFFTRCGNSNNTADGKKLADTRKTNAASTSNTKMAEGRFVVKIPGGTSPSDKRYNDVTEVLRVALEKTKAVYGSYELRVSDKPMTGTRFVEEAKSGKNVNVIWRTYTPELAKDLLPIYIDPRKGLMGYRIFLIRKEEQAAFSKIRSLEELRKYVVGQGQDWLDIEVFKYNGLRVATGTSYEGLFKMLINKRFDYFSRGIGEAFVEYNDRKKELPGLHVEEKIALYYPWPYFYFVNPQCPEIAERIKKGLEIMLKDGSLDKLFIKYNKSVIEKANLKSRKVIRLKNPLLMKAPIDMKAPGLWYDPEK